MRIKWISLGLAQNGDICQGSNNWITVDAKRYWIWGMMESLVFPKALGFNYIGHFEITQSSVLNTVSWSWVLYTVTNSFLYIPCSGISGGSVKNLPAIQETWVRSGRSPRVGNDNPFQYSSLGNPMDRGAWWAPVHGVTKSWT